MSETIVVGTDGSSTAKQAVAEAMRLARALDADLHVVSAYERTRSLPVTGPGGQPAVAAVGDGEVDATLAAAAASARDAGLRVETHAVRLDPAEALVTVAGEVGASLIVVGSQGMHGAKRVLGSVPNSVSHKAQCNVLIVATQAP
jgi:nucleotide-binding universal stress UspA family protein